MDFQVVFAIPKKNPPIDISVAFDATFKHHQR